MQKCFGVYILIRLRIWELTSEGKIDLIILGGLSCLPTCVKSYLKILKLSIASSAYFDLTFCIVCVSAIYAFNTLIKMSWYKVSVI